MPARARAQTDLVNLEVVNAVTLQPVAGLSVLAYKRSGATSSWFASRTTDSAGHASVVLTGVSSGVRFYFSANPFGTGTIQSADVTAAGAFRFAVGTLAVTVVAGGTNAPLAAKPINLKEKLADGSLQQKANGTTSSSGFITFHPVGLGSGRVFVLEAASPWDGTTQRSNEIRDVGGLTFVVGNAPLDVTALDAISNTPLASLVVHAYERVAGALQWRKQLTTNANGMVTFDLAGLGSGRTYMLRATKFNALASDSEDLQAAGDFVFRLGKLKVFVVAGGTGQPLASTKVDVYERRPDQTLVWSKGATTDTSGVVRFDLAGLGQGRTYVLRAKSPADGTNKYSSDITQNGTMTFTVGSGALRVTLLDAITGAALSGQSLAAYERLAGGGSGSPVWRTTDGAGKAAFDLPGLGSGRTYYLAAWPFGTGKVVSDDLSAPADYAFRVGKVELTVRSPLDGTPLTGTQVNALEKHPDGSLTWAASGTTNAQGINRFDLVGLGSGRVYVFSARSLTDGYNKLSQDITQNGRHVFTVGNLPLRVALVNAFSTAPLPQVMITARELRADGSTPWVRDMTTDAGGVALFDLDGLGSGRRYVLYARPYNAGGVTSDPIDAPGDVFFRVGTVPATLIDDDNDVPLTGARLLAYEKFPDGTRTWVAEGYADGAGTVRFDLAGLSQTIARQLPPAPRAATRLYAIRAANPFGNYKEYWSPVLLQEGPVTMRIQRALAQPLDATPPAVSIASPGAGANVDAGGFAMVGTASDNIRVERVTVTVNDPLRGTATLAAGYDGASRQWSATIGADLVSSGHSASVSVNVYDAAENRATASRSVNVITDSTPPQVTFVTPAGATVPVSGFLANGTATDNVGVTSLTATVDDPPLGRTVSQSLALGAGGQWSFTVLSGQVSAGQTAVVTVTARDGKDQQHAVTRTLQVSAVDFLAHHLINRITFGTTPGLLAEVEQIGADAFREQQLTPQSLDDSVLEAQLPAAPATKAELQRQTLLRMMRSRRQLLEVMTQFWDNHFNTDVNKHAVVAYEANENAAFRQHALGRFRDLLGISAKSPAMLHYLDQATSERGDPNENYARELLELHTLGIDGGYTQGDVEQVARAFTGWTVANGQFVFNGFEHDANQKVVLGTTLPAGRGIADGEQVLDLLAAHPSTALFICSKLARLLVSDAPPVALVARCAGWFSATDGDITAVVRIILRSPEFADATAFRAKVRTPVETAVFWARAFGATGDAAGLPGAISEMGMRLFENPIPTGWSETGDDWINTNLLLQRIKQANRLVRNQIPGLTVNLPGFFTAHGHTSADEIVTFVFEQLFHDDYTPLDRDTAMDVLTDGGQTSFAVDQPDAEARLQRMLGTVFSFPQSQAQ